LQAALDDLYLVIDSLDTVEGSLENVLGAYRARIAPKCEAAGIALDWQIEGTQTGRLSAPTTMLQLCRILQEAISNAIRHGKATRIRMLLSEAAGQTTVTLTDNGSGFDPSTVEGLGRGLTSMRKRAASIGARLAFTDANPGCRISITLPFAANPGHP
jgi:signal transduction histidine kinase